MIFNLSKTALYGSTTLALSVVLSTSTALAATSGCISGDCTGYTKTAAQCAGKAAIRCLYDSSKYFCISDDPACDSSYKYTCTGYREKPSGDSCGGKYKKCSCSGNYDWSSIVGCYCKSRYQYTCTPSAAVKGGASDSCDGEYSECKCNDGYVWDGNVGDCINCVENYYIYTCSPRIAVAPACEGTGKYRECICKEAGHKWDPSLGDCVYR